MSHVYVHKAQPVGEDMHILSKTMIYIVHTHYGESDGPGELHLVRTSRELAQLFKSIEHTSRNYDIYEIPEYGPMREISAPEDDEDGPLSSSEFAELVSKCREPMEPLPEEPEPETKDPDDNDIPF